METDRQLMLLLVEDILFEEQSRLRPTKVLMDGRVDPS